MLGRLGTSNCPIVSSTRSLRSTERIHFDEAYFA
jgi:hypothetical protein